MSTCRQCKKLYRADQVWDQLKESEWLNSLETACAPGGGDTIIFDRRAGNEQSISNGQRDVAGDLPIQIHVRLKTEEPIVAGRLVDRSFLIEFREEK